MSINKGIDIQKLKIPQTESNEVIIVKIDIDIYDLNEAQSIFTLIRDTLNTQNIIGIPTGVEMSVSEIDDAIKYLEDMKQRRII